MCQIWLHVRYESRKNENPSIFILGYLKIKLWRIWAVFSMKNPLHRSKSYIFRLKFGEISPPPQKKLSLCMHPVEKKMLGQNYFADTKGQCFDFSSSNSLLLGHILSTSGDVLSKNI